MRQSEDIDELWEACKDQVDKRDRKRCQFEKCLSITESHQLEEGSPKTIDRAHIFSRSQYPSLKYNINNIISLKRYIHNRMDEYRCPLTGDQITLEKHYYWWWRIFNKRFEKYDSEKDYELLLKQNLGIIS